MAEPDSGTAPVTDRRSAPRGVLPRGIQTWLMLGLALGILAIIVFAGRPAPAPGPAEMAAPTATAPNPDRLRDYQDRLRVLDERARQQTPDQVPLVQTRPNPYTESPGAAPAAIDPLESERKRREYESLFSSNVVMSRRPEGERLASDAPVAVRRPYAASDEGVPAPPSLDEVADAVVRATSRHSQPDSSNDASPQTRPSVSDAPATRNAGVGRVKERPIATGPITSTGFLHRVLEGTIIETVLTNRLDGSVAAPVNCLVTTPIYSHDRQYVLIPAGSRVLGETRPVQVLGETRLAVTFSRLALPDGRTYRLDQFMGLNDIGDAGLRDQVNHHYRSTFGASAAVGLISGFAQFLGSLGLNRGSGDRTVVVTGNVGDATAQASAQTMNRFLNRLPTITIREGHRVNVYLTGDLDLPAYEARERPSRPVLAGIR